MKKDIPVEILTIIGKLSEKIPRLIKIIADDTVILHIVHGDISKDKLHLKICHCYCM